MKDESAILYVQTTSDPSRQYSPLVLAQSAKAMDLKPTLYYLGMGLVVLRPGHAEEIKMGSFPTVREMLDKTMAMGIPVLACEASKQMLGWDEVELIEGVKIVGAATLNDLALDAGATMWFQELAMTHEVYLDYQSAKPVDPRVVEAMLPYFTERFGNPAALHGVGDRGTEALEEGRARVADFIAAAPDEIVFTSGATESTNLALLGFTERNRRLGDHIVMSEVEHISEHNLAKALEKDGFRVTKVPPDQYGRIDPEKLRARLTDDTVLVSVGWASNEIGTVQPIAEIADMLHGTGVTLHVDAVAAEGLLPIDVSKVPVGMLTLSGNDIYGPPGVGALFVRKGVRVSPVMIGGGQERGLRSGTENLPGIVGMGRAAEIASVEMPTETPRLAAMRDRLIDAVLATIPDSHLNGHPTERLPNNAHFRFEGVEGESLLLMMQDAGIAVSTGSACSSKTLEPSHTLISCGLLHEEAHGSLEFTFGRFSEESDVDRVMEVLPGIVGRLRDLSPLYPSSQTPTAGRIAAHERMRRPT